MRGFPAIKQEKSKVSARLWQGWYYIMGGRKGGKDNDYHFYWMLNGKRNKTVLGIFILTAILGIFAVERAFSISRSSSLMNSFSDLYTLAFKNLTSLFLPIVLSMFATTLFFLMNRKMIPVRLLIIPDFQNATLFFKDSVVIFMSLALCLLTFAICIAGGFLAGGFTDLNTETILQAGLLFLAGGVLVPLVSVLSVIFLATLAKGYVHRLGLHYFILCLSCLFRRGLWTAPTGECYEFIPIFHLTQQKWLRNGREWIEITISPNICLISLVIGSISAIVSVLALRKQTCWKWGYMMNKYVIETKQLTKTYGEQNGSQFC